MEKKEITREQWDNVLKSLTGLNDKLKSTTKPDISFERRRVQRLLKEAAKNDEKNPFDRRAYVYEQKKKNYDAQVEYDSKRGAYDTSEDDINLIVEHTED